jgi:hypothetical protein
VIVGFQRRTRKQAQQNSPSSTRRIDHQHLHGDALTDRQPLCGARRGSTGLFRPIAHWPGCRRPCSDHAK